MALNLHISPGKPDWETIRPNNWNTWQKLAAGTKGWITPANAVSSLGVILIIIGLWHLKNDATLTGVSFILAGRLADVADGFIADKTGTKSPLGELVDTTSDKLIAAITIITLFIYGLLPILILAAVGLHTIVNSSVSLLGRQRGTIIHPSLEGKLATFLAWTVIISYLAYLLVENRAALFLTWLIFAGFMYLAVRSTSAYIVQLKRTK